MPLRQLRVEYKDFEAKRNLSNRYQVLRGAIGAQWANFHIGRTSDQITDKIVIGSKLQMYW